VQEIARGFARAAIIEEAVAVIDPCDEPGRSTSRDPLGRDAMSRTPDLSVVYCGSAFLLRATSPTGQQWIVRHIPGNARWFGGVVAVEHRYIDAIIQGAIDDGLSTSGGRTVL
jgi:hypothetical protein